MAEFVAERLCADWRYDRGGMEVELSAGVIVLAVSGKNRPGSPPYDATIAEEKRAERTGRCNSYNRRQKAHRRLSRRDEQFAICTVPP